MAKEKKITLAVREAIGRAKRIVSSFGKMQGVVNAIMVEQYPTKRQYMAMDWDAHAVFLRTLRGTDGETTQAYMYATAWLRENRGGLRNKAGDGFKSSTHADGPIPAGVFLRTMSVKLEAAFEYLAKAPKQDLEPALFADLSEVCAAIEKAYTVLEAYRELDKAAQADDAEASKIAKAKAEIKAGQTPETKAKIAAVA